MARRVRDSKLESRTARAKLDARGKPYYRSIGPGLHVGYRKGKTAGRWVARFYVGDQNYRVETIADADDTLDADGVRILDFWQAQEQARDRFQQMAGGEDRVAGRYTVRDAMDDYLEWMDANRKSAGDARTRTKVWILPTLGDIEVTDLTAERIRKWQRDMAQAPARLRSKEGAQNVRETSDDADGPRRRRATANRVLTILKAALNYAFREGKASSDREWRRVEPFENVEAARVRYLTVQEAQRLLNAAQGQFRQLANAALQTGARYGELIKMRVEDFNPDVGTVAVRASKGGKPRHIVLTGEGQELFWQQAAGKPRDALLFTMDNGQPWQKSSQARPMAEACKNARITPAIGFHGLRHTWASLSAMNGVPLLVIAKNLGHTDTRMVEKHYGHLSPSYIADAIRAGAPKFGAVSESNLQTIGAAKW